MCRWHTRPDYIYCGCSDIILTRQAFPHNIVQVHIQLCGRFQDYPSVADRLSPWLLILEAVQHQILNTEICKWTDPLCPPFPKCPKTIRPRQFRYLPFSFVTPHSGTQRFYGTQCHQGLPTAQCDSTSFFDPQLHALLLKHCAGLPAHLPAAPPPPCWPYYPFQKCCPRCEPPIIFPVPFYSLQVPWGWRLKSRQSLTCLLLLLSLADLIISLPFLQSRPQPLSVPIGPAVQAVGFLASLILSIAGRSRGQVSVEQAILASRWSPIYIRWRLAHNSFSGSPPASARLLHSHLPSSDPTLKVKKQSALTQFLWQGQNGQLSSPPSLSDSPSLYWFSRFGRMSRLSMLILQVYAPKYLCEYNLPTSRSQSWQPLAKAHSFNPLQAVVWMVSFSFFTFRQCFDLVLSIWYEPY